jgi:hypothetical protein
MDLVGNAVNRSKTKEQHSDVHADVAKSVMTGMAI